MAELQWKTREVALAGEKAPSIIQIEQPGKMPRAQVFEPHGYRIGEEDRELARRIVACLNACAGISTSELERAAAFGERNLPPEINAVARIDCLEAICTDLRANLRDRLGPES